MTVAPMTIFALSPARAVEIGSRGGASAYSGPAMTSGAIKWRTVAPAAATALVILIGGALAEAMYRFAPATGAAMIVAPALLALVVWKPLLGLYASLLSIPLEAFGTSVGSTTVTPAKALLILTAVAILPRLLTPTAPRRLSTVHLWFLVLLAVSLLGLAFAPDKHAVLVITGNAFAYLVISIYVSRLDRKESNRVLLVLVLSGGIVGVLTILTSGGPDVAASSDNARAQLGFDSPNVLAFYLLLTLAPALAMIAEAAGWKQRLLALGVAPMIIVGLVLTQSRSAILGAGLAVAILLGSSRFRRMAAALAVVLVGVVAFNFGAVMRSPQIAAVQQRLAAIDSVAGVQHDPRILIWKTTPRIIAAHPVFGVGEGNFPAVSPGYGLLAYDLTPIDHAHDIFLTVGAELGLVGLAVFLAFLLALTRSAWRALTRTRSARGPILGLVAALAGLFFTSIGDYPARAPTVLATLMIMVGLVLAHERQTMGVAPSPVPTTASSGL